MNDLDRTKKSQEMHAEQLLKLSTSLLTAFLISILLDHFTSPLLLAHHLETTLI